MCWKSFIPSRPDEQGRTSTCLNLIVYLVSIEDRIESLLMHNEGCLPAVHNKSTTLRSGLSIHSVAAPVPQISPMTILMATVALTRTRTVIATSTQIAV